MPPPGCGDDGAFLVSSEADVSALAGTEAISGIALCFLEVSDDVVWEFPELRRITSSLSAEIWRGHITLKFPKLEQAGHVILAAGKYSSGSISAEFPELVEVNNVAMVGDVRSVTLPRLTRAESVAFQDTAIDVLLPSLVEVLELSSYGSAAQVELPLLGEARYVGLELALAQDVLSLPALRTGSVTLELVGQGPREVRLPMLESSEQFIIGPSASLLSIQTPKLSRSTNFVVARNRALSGIELPELISITRIQIQQNDALPQCWVDDLVARSGATDVRTSENTGAQGCP